MPFFSSVLSFSPTVFLSAYKHVQGSINCKNKPSRQITHTSFQTSFRPVFRFAFVSHVPFKVQLLGRLLPSFSPHSFNPRLAPVSLPPQCFVFQGQPSLLPPHPSLNAKDVVEAFISFPIALAHRVVVSPGPGGRR